MSRLPCLLPVTHYFRCVDDADPPRGYAGDWPVRGAVYAGTLKPAVHTGAPHLHLAGFHAEPPWGAFAAGRFDHFVSVWLN